MTSTRTLTRRGFGAMLSGAFIAPALAAPAILAARAPRTLIVFATMMGSTQRQAEIIGGAFVEAGHQVTVAQVPEAPDPAPFDTAILGSAIKGGAWLDEIVDYAAHFESRLAARPVALFQCSMRCAGIRHDDPDRALTNAEIIRLSDDLATLHAAAPKLLDAPVGFFAGALDLTKWSLPRRLAYYAISGTFLSGDFTHAGQLRRFARELIQQRGFGTCNPVCGP